MAQFARPTADLDNTGVWTTAPLWSKIDEAPGAEDATFAVSDANPTITEPFTVDLSTVSDPAVSTGHIIRAHWSRQSGTQVNYRAIAELRQGYVSEASQGTLIATLTGTTLGNTLTTQSYTLTGTEADSITDYADLQLRIYSEKQGGGATGNWHVEWVEVEFPDAGPPSQSGGSTAAVTVTAEGAGTPPLEIPGDLPIASIIGIWDARNIAGSVNDSVGSWADDGPKNQDPLVQATGANQPTINESGFGGIRALLFDGTNDELNVTLDQSYTGDFALITVLEVLTYPTGSAAVAYSTGSIPNKNILGVDDVEDPPGWVVMSSDDGTQAQHHHGTDDQTYLEATPSRFVMTQLVRNSGVHKLWENGILVIDLTDSSGEGSPLNNMGALKMGAREDSSRFINMRLGYQILVDLAEASETQLLSAQDDLAGQFDVPGFGISGGSTAAVSASPEGAGAKQILSGATASITVTPEDSGSSARSSGSTAAVSVTTEGAGVALKSSGATSNVQVTGEGDGTPARTGASTSDVTVSSSGDGVKADSGGSTADVSVVASGTGSSSEGEPDGGSTASVGVTAEGNGNKVSTGGATGAVSVTTSSAGLSARSGGNTASVESTTTTDGTKAGQSGATASIEVTAEGGGSAVDLVSGGSTAQVSISPSGEGAKTTSGASTANVTVAASGGGTLKVRLRLEGRSVSGFGAEGSPSGVGLEGTRL